MSSQGPKDEASDLKSTRQQAAALSRAAAGPRVDGDSQIVQSCLSGEERAWERLYRRYHPRLRRAIELLLGADTSEPDILEEIASRVWWALLRDDCRLLKTFDADRDSSLDGFLMGLARIEILRYARSERRRASHERLAGHKRLEEDRVSDWELAAMMDEFRSRLTPREREFMERFLMGPPEDETDAEPEGLPPTTVWTRRYRIRRKLIEFLEEPE